MPQLLINGAQIYYEEHGQGSETILFSHGLLFSSAMFAKQIAHLKSRFKCIAYDHRGQGQSELKGSLDMDQLSDDAAELIEKLGIGPCHFVGLSMGGFVGLRLAARKPNLLQSLVLLDTSAQPEAFKFKYNLLKSVVSLFGVGVVTGKVMPIMFGQKFLKDSEREGERLYWQNYLSSLPKAITKAVGGVVDRKGVTDELRKIKLPTLILVGDQDMATPVAKAETIAKGIRHAKLKVISGAGHSATIEEPRKVNSMLDEFLHEFLS